jgi:hypothetical protein
VLAKKFNKKLNKKKTMNVVLYTKEHLHSLCKRKKWRGYSKYKKSDLVQFVQNKLQDETKAACRLQRWYKTYIRHLKLVNDTDFVSLEEFEEGECLFKLLEHRQIYRFRPDQLIQSILSSGQFINPYTRTALSENSLTRLHQVYLKTNKTQNEIITFTLKGVVRTINSETTLTSIQKALTQELKDNRERERTIQFLVSLCRDIHSEIIDICTHAITDDIDTISSVVSYVFGFHFPILQDSMVEIVNVSQQNAVNLMISFIRDVSIVAMRSPLHNRIMRLYLQQLNSLQIRN